MSNFEIQQKYIVQKLNSVIFSLKKVLKTKSKLNLSLEQNSLTLRAVGNSQVFLICPFITNKNRILEIVAACAASMDMESNYQESLDDNFISNLLDFICSTDKIFIKSQQNGQVLLISNSQEFTVLEDTGLGKIGTSIFVRSLCVLLAVCGKEVTNSYDSTKLNNQGCVSIYERNAASR